MFNATFNKISMPIYLLQMVFYPQNRPCTPKIVGTFYMQGYKVKEKLYPQFQNSVGTLKLSVITYNMVISFICV